MNLFDPNRPEIANGQKAILIDGSVIPNLLLTPQANGLIRLMCLLRNYDIGPTSGHSYSYRQTELPSAELGTFFDLFRANPEQTLEDYFFWKPKASATNIVPLRPMPKNNIIALATKPMEDLL